MTLPDISIAMAMFTRHFPSPRPSLWRCPKPSSGVAWEVEAMEDSEDGG